MSKKKALLTMIGFILLWAVVTDAWNYSGILFPAHMLSFGKYLYGYFSRILVVTGGLSVQDYFGILPAESYEDKGVYIFRPYQVLPMQAENNATGREKRMNPTRTVYMVYYRDMGAFRFSA